MRSSFLGQSHASAAESAGFQAARPVLATTTASRSPSSSLVVYAGPAGRARRNAGKGPTPKPPPGMPKRPDSGFFADTDPNGRRLRQQIILKNSFFCLFPGYFSANHKNIQHCFLFFLFLQLPSILSAAVFKETSLNAAVGGKVTLFGIRTGKMH